MTSSSTKPFQHFLEPEVVVGVCVAYGELAEFTSGPFDAEVAGQAMVEGGAVDFDDVHFGELRENLEGAVRRAAVDDDDFLDGDGLLEDALNALPDALGLVPNGMMTETVGKPIRRVFAKRVACFWALRCGRISFLAAVLWLWRRLPCGWMPSRSAMFWIRSPNVRMHLVVAWNKRAQLHSEHRGISVSLRRRILRKRWWPVP